MIRVEEFAFQYPTADEDALKRVSFSVESGDVLGVVGPVEAGKTTLSMALAGFVPDVTGGEYEGDLTVAGRDPIEADDNRVAMVFEDYSSQLTQLRVIDEVVAPLTNRGISRSEATDRARELLDQVRLGDVSEDKHTWELSGGQQQRLAIAAVLALEPDVLIFDTATDMLDPKGRQEVTNLLSSLKGETTLVVTENRPDPLVGIADRLLVLDRGEVVDVGPAEDILRDRELFEDIGVDPPVCLDVARRVGLDGDPITTNEFVDALKPHLEERTARRPIPDGDASVPGTPSPVTESFGDPLIEVNDVSFEYPDGTVAVSEANLTLHEGEVHAIVGANGAGKSTFTKLLVGLLNPTSGRVDVSGTDTREATARDLAESVGIALQNPDEQISRGTVDEEIAYALRLRQYERAGLMGLFRKQRQFDDDFVAERVAEARELVGIDDDLRESDPAFLPRGGRRLVTIAGAYVTDPDALVLDEPAAGLDADAKGTVRTAIDRLRRDDKGIVLVEHDIEFVCEVADRITVLDEGVVAMQGPTETVFAQDNWEWLAERYLRPPLVGRLADRVGMDAITANRLVGELSEEVEVSG